MEGYSVTEAASVLGVPTERVWELLARGVLSGVPDGETGMRVFLQPRPAPPTVDEPRRSNGGGSGREPEAEASPFRELLSEFRNLTERYGQALLALGESRGEVASLRSRVDLLEARFDLRLPMSGSTTAQAPAAAGWNARQAAPRPMAEPVPAEDAAGAPPDREEAEPSPPRRRRRGQHRATDDFAEALARAEDPSPAELPGGEEAAAAFAALRDEAAHRTVEHADAALPRELPAAEPIAIIEPDDIAEVVPQPIAEADVALEDAPEPMAATSTVEVEAVTEELAEPIAEAPAVEAEAVDAEPQPVVDEPAARAVEAEAAQPIPQPIVEELAAHAIEAEAIVNSAPEPIDEVQQPSTVEPEIAFDGLTPESEPEAEPRFEPEPAAEPEPEPVMEASSAEAELEAAIEAQPEPMAEAPAASMAETEPEPEPELAAGAESIEAEPEAPEEQAEPVVDEPEPHTVLEADEEPDESAAAGPAEWEDGTRAEPALEAEVESDTEAEPEGLADAEPSWDRDRYTARIEEPDWIPEERSPQPATTTSPEAEAPFVDERRHEPDSEGSDAEPAAPEPPWVGEPGRSTPTGEETMLWFGREPNRAAPAWPTEDDSAAEMEVASTGGHATRLRPVPDEPIAFRPAPAVPPAELPDIRAEYRASLRPQPPSPASRAYRRLRRIFPG